MEEKKNNQKTLTIVLAIALAVCAILAVVFGVKSNKVSGLLKESTEEAARLTKEVEDNKADAEERIAALMTEKEEAVSAAEAAAEEQLAALTAEKEEAVAAAKAEAEEKITALTAEAEEKIAALQAEKDEAVATGRSC